MHYHTYEMAHAALAPVRFQSRLLRRAMTSPFNPLAYTKAGWTVAAACEVLDGVTKRYGKPSWGITSTRIYGLEVPVREEIAGGSSGATMTHRSSLTSTSAVPLVWVRPRPVAGFRHGLLHQGVAQIAYAVTFQLLVVPTLVSAPTAVTPDRSESGVTSSRATRPDAEVLIWPPAPISFLPLGQSTVADFAAAESRALDAETRSKPGTAADAGLARAATATAGARSIACARHRTGRVRPSCGLPS